MAGVTQLVVRRIKCQDLKTGVQSPQMCEPAPKRNKYLIPRAVQSKPLTICILITNKICKEKTLKKKKGIYK